MIRRFWKSDAGTSVIEFALVTPLLVFMFVGLVDVGRSMYLGIVAANAARAGASYGSQNWITAQDQVGMQNAAKTDGAGVSWTVNATPLCSVSGGTPSPCSFSSSSAPTNTVYYVQVNVSGSFNTLVHYPGIATSIPVSGNSIMRLVEQ